MSGSLFNIFNRTWTIQDLLAVEANRVQKSAGCSVSFVNCYREIVQESILEKFKRFFTRKKDAMNVFYVTFKFEVISDTGHKYPVLIRTMADPNASEYMKNKIQIYCGCNDFKYRSAWVLNNHGALFVTVKSKAKLGAGLTDSPSNKTKTSVLCKHAYSAVNFFMNNYSALMAAV